MRVLVVSDLHANAAALEILDDHVDGVVFLGDAVDYGPDPERSIAWLRSVNAWAVRGNHDQAVARSVTTGASPALADVAERSAAWTRERLDDDAKTFLGSLPERLSLTLGGARFLALHAAPSDPLYKYLPPETDAETWEAELADVDADWLLCGHTHRPFLRRFGKVTVLNPGSLGQPRTGMPHASYAIWDDGDVFLAARRYDVDRVLERVAQMRLDPRGEAQLVRVLRTGDV